MKAALDAWGAGSNLFHQGVARESGDAEVVAATMSKPGVVLRRPVGSAGPFREHADLPTDLAGDGPKLRPRKTLAKPKDQVPRTTDDTVARKAALAFEREQRLRRPPGRGSASDATKQLPRRTQRWKRVKGSTISGWRQSRPSGTLSKRNRTQRMPVGRRRRMGWRGLCAERESKT